MLKAKFKTAYLQKELALDIVVAGSSDLHVGQVVKYVPASGNIPAYITAAATEAEGTHIIAQSDTTLEYGHVPVEDRNYAYSDVVKPSVATAANGSPSKKVAVFAITDKQDIIIYSV